MSLDGDMRADAMLLDEQVHAFEPGQLEELLLLLQQDLQEALADPAHAPALAAFRAGLAASEALPQLPSAMEAAAACNITTAMAELLDWKRGCNSAQGLSVHDFTTLLQLLLKWQAAGQPLPVSSAQQAAQLEQELAEAMLDTDFYEVDVGASVGASVRPAALRVCPAGGLLLEAMPAARLPHAPPSCTIAACVPTAYALRFCVRAGLQTGMYLLRTRNLLQVLQRLVSHDQLRDGMFIARAAPQVHPETGERVVSHPLDSLLATAVQGYLGAAAGPLMLGLYSDKSLVTKRKGVHPLLLSVLNMPLDKIAVGGAFAAFCACCGAPCGCGRLGAFTKDVALVRRSRLLAENVKVACAAATPCWRRSSASRLLAAPWTWWTPTGGNTRCFQCWPSSHAICLRRATSCAATRCVQPPRMTCECGRLQCPFAKNQAPNPSHKPHKP